MVSPAVRSGSPTAGASADTQVLGSRLARDEALIGAPAPRNDFFGFFGPFIAFTGRDILTLVGSAAVALLSGIAAVAVARRRVRRTAA